MDNKFGCELARQLQRGLGNRYFVQPTLPLDIKLRLERLRLVELIGACQSAAVGGRANISGSDHQAECSA